MKADEMIDQAYLRRSLFRIAPVFFRLVENNWFHSQNMSCLPVLRALMVAGMESIPIGAAPAKRNPTLYSAIFDQMALLNSPVTNSREPKADHRGQPAFDEASSALRVIAEFVSLTPATDARLQEAMREIFETCRGIAHEFGFDDRSLIEEREADLRAINDGVDPLERPLWSQRQPLWFREANGQWNGFMQTFGTGEFEFWQRWWSGVVNGQPLDLALQREVALIPDDIWQAGPGAVAERIAIIEEKYRLKDEVVSLRQQMEAMQQGLAQAASVAQRGHNNPPELIEPDVAFRQDVEKVVATLAEAEAELAKPEPKRSIIRSIVATLGRLAKSVGVYCASIGDDALREAAKTFGKTVGPALALHLTGLLEHVIKALQAFLNMLPW